MREITGVEDLLFMHKDGFMAMVKSYEGAFRLADTLLSHAGFKRN